VSDFIVRIDGQLGHRLLIRPVDEYLNYFLLDDGDRTLVGIMGYGLRPFIQRAHDGSGSGWLHLGTIVLMISEGDALNAIADYLGLQEG
jgi:hypothetical protein